MNEHNSKQGQREFERIPKKVSVTVHRYEHQPNAKQAGEAGVTKNIAEKGVCICVPSPYEPGTKLTLRIDLEGWQVYLRTVLSRPDNGSEIKPLTATGKVIWSQELPGEEGYEVGIQFTDIDEEHFKAFKKYLHIIRETVR